MILVVEDRVLVCDFGVFVSVVEFRLGLGGFSIFFFISVVWVGVFVTFIRFFGVFYIYRLFFVWALVCFVFYFFYRFFGGALFL